MGGGGFSSDPENRLLDDFVLELCGAGRPRVCFLATASGDADGYICRFYDAFPVRRCLPSHLPLFARRRDEDPRDLLLDQDVVYVGGGNTVNMLAVWRAHGVDAALREAWQRGIVLCGLSAGSLCWFEAGVTDSYGGLDALRDGLGLVAGSHCPHYDSEPGRRPAYTRLVGEGLPGGVAADDGVGLHYVDGRLAEVVSSRPAAGAYRVERRPHGRADETPLTVRRLG
jgi:dipeptidase E